MTRVLPDIDPAAAALHRVAAPPLAAPGMRECTAAAPGMATRLRSAGATFAAVALLTACASDPPAPAWQNEAKASIERAVSADLRGETRIAGVEYKRARDEIGSTGRPELVARMELIRCAAAVASTVFDACGTFEALRADAAPAELAYAAYLAGIAPPDAKLLPPPHRDLAERALAGEAAAVALRAIEDPLARLVAAGVLLRAGRADSQVIAVAVDTASAQGWRRPLLAWLGVQLAVAEQAGNAAEASRVRRRLEVVGR